jgi:hypothetical protein
MEDHRTYALSAVKPGFFVRIWLRNTRFLVETGFLCVSPGSLRSSCHQLVFLIINV